MEQKNFKLNFSSEPLTDYQLKLKRDFPLDCHDYGYWIVIEGPEKLVGCRLPIGIKPLNYFYPVFPDNIYIIIESLEEKKQEEL
jgi:hypothetical protein